MNLEINMEEIDYLASSGTLLIQNGGNHSMKNLTIIGNEFGIGQISNRLEREVSKLLGSF